MSNFPRFRATPKIRREFERDGYYIARGLFDAAEVELLLNIGKADVALAAEATHRADAEGGRTTLALRNDLDDGLYSAIVRSRRVVDAMEVFLDGEVYHYHHKMMLKEPRVGGAWEWHQDYGYWYDYGCLLPKMGSCLIAIDRANEENGCLQVLRGSHAMGRVEHGKVGGQTGADAERVAAAQERFESVFVECEPGDALFFHGNLLHRSDQNRSENPRWSLICCYNSADNDPYKESRHPGYSPLSKIDDDKVLEIGRRHWAQMQQASE